MKHLFEIEGDPVGKGRPRFTKQGRAYTPKRTKDYESRVRKAYIDSGGPHFDEQPLIIRVTAVMQMPKSWSNKKRKQLLDTPCTKKPDADNILKSIQDGLLGAAYQDDCQIYDTGCMKVWGDHGKAIVWIASPEK